MKKIVLMLALMMATMTVAANNILYFTYSQAARTVACLNSQNELMIYCGYENELPTYVLINEVWAEQISSSFYEIWLYGYDAYTGEEIYMPIDLECIYLMQNRNIYSAAQYLRFKYTHSRPTFVWVMPPYNPFVRVARPVTYYYTYHYDIHRPGWHWRHYPHIHYHPYYRRIPGHPAPIPPKPYTPGKEYPGYHTTQDGYQYNDLPLVGRVTAPRSATTVQNNPTGRSGSRITSDRKSNTITSTDRVTGSRTTTNAPSRNESLEGSGTRGNSISSRSSDTETRSGNATTRSGDNSNSRNRSTTSRSGSSTSRSGNNTGSTNSRSGNTSTRDDNNQGTTTSRTGTVSSRTDDAASTVRNNSSSRSGNNTENKVSSDNNTSRNGNNRKPEATRTTTSRSTSSATPTSQRSGNVSRQNVSRDNNTSDNNSRGNVSTPSRGSQTSSRNSSTRRN